MGEFNRVAFVWGETGNSAPLAQPPSISVAMWPNALGCDLLRWKAGQMPDISQYDLFLVNVFHTPDSTQCQQIKRIRPDARVIAMPDAPVDMVLAHPNWLPMWEELAAADMIGGRTPYDVNVYGTFFNKPAIWLPSPAGHLDYFAQYRDVEKEDYILTLDHSFEGYATGQNVAAVAAIQRETGMRVVYARPYPHTKKLAALAGLDAEWREPNIPWLEMIEVTAKARLCVDIYARHSYGRQGVLCAMVGTPFIGSAWTNFTGGININPMCPKAALGAWEAIAWDTYPEAYEDIRATAFDVYKREFSFEAARERIRSILDPSLAKPDPLIQLAENRRNGGI